MAMLVQDVDLSRQLIAERRRLGHDRFDEVWEGVYVMNPLPNNEHQELQTPFDTSFDDGDLGIAARQGHGGSQRE